MRNGSGAYRLRRVRERSQASETIGNLGTGRTRTQLEGSETESTRGEKHIQEKEGHISSLPDGDVQPGRNLGSALQ